MTLVKVLIAAALLAGEFPGATTPPVVGPASGSLVITRGRQKDMVPVIRAHPELLGIGIDEDTALVVHGDLAEVIGSSRVLVYDAARWGGEEGGNDAPEWFSLQPGDRFDLGTRRRVAR